MTPPSIDLLVLDVNGVLYSYDPEQRIARMAAALGATEAEVRAAVFESGLEDAADAGEIGPQTYLDRVSEELGIVLERDVWADALAAAVEPDQSVLELVERVTHQVAVTTLSNNGLLVRRMVERIYPALTGLDVEFHVAAEFGESKPDEHVYLDVCERFSVVPSRAAFVDDKETNAEGARLAGLRAHQYVGLDGLVSFLTELGLSVD